MEKHSLFDNPGSPRQTRPSACLCDSTPNELACLGASFSDEGIKKLALPPVFDARNTKNPIRPSAWPGRHRYITNVLCSPWARFAHPDSWSTPVLIVVLRLLVLPPYVPQYCRMWMHY